MARAFGEDLAPTFKLVVEGTELGADLTQHVQSVEFESAADMADLLRVVVENPGWKNQEVLDALSPAREDLGAHKAFQPGNEASLYLGYGSADSPENFVGRAHLAKHLPDFPREGIPTLEVKGYDRSYYMMNASGRITGGNPPRLHESRPLDDADDQGQVFQNALHSEVVSTVGEMYGFHLDVDVTDKPENVVLKKGMTHYQLVKGLANLNDREFWVDYDAVRRRWVLHWKKRPDEQRADLEFVYGDGDATTLLEFRPEYGLRDTITEAVILIFDARNKRWVSAGEFDDFDGPDPKFRPGGGLMAEASEIPPHRTNRRTGRLTEGAQRSRREARRAQDVIDEALASPGAFRIAACGVAIDVLPPGQRFADAEQAARFLRRWFLARRDNFVIGQGVVVGVEGLRARQVHRLKGIGVRLTGDWYFTAVRHRLTPGEVYECEFTAHRIMGS